MVFGPLGFQPGAGDEETHRPTRSRNGEQESEQSCWNASAPKKGRLPLQYHFLWKRRGESTCLADVMFKIYVELQRFLCCFCPLQIISDLPFLNRFDLCLPSAIWILLQYASTKPFVGMQHTKMTTTNCSVFFWTGSPAMKLADYVTRIPVPKEPRHSQILR